MYDINRTPLDSLPPIPVKPTGLPPDGFLPRNKCTSDGLLGTNKCTDDGLLPSNKCTPPQANRYNAGKVDYTLLPIDALTAEAKVWMGGEKKYGRHNWEKLWGDDTVNVAMASALRHSYAILEGELIDQESGLPHAAHVRCNMAMIIRWMENEGITSSSS